MRHSAKVLVVGLGSAHGDDQAGWLVAEHVSKKVSGTLDSSEEQDEYPMWESSRHLFQHVIVRRAMVPLDVLDWLEGISVLHICDACQTTKTVRRLQRLTWNAGQLVGSDQAADSDVNTALKSLRGRGSHDFGLTDVLRLAEITGMLPKQVVIWAIAANCFQPEDVMSDETRKTVSQAVNEMILEISVPHA